MGKETLAWAATCVDRAARVVGVLTLHSGEGPWLLRVSARAGLVEVVLRAPTPRIDGDMIATNVAALLMAERHSLPAPRLLGASVIAGVPVSVETVVAGSSGWPAPIGAAGAAIARVHRISLTPSDDLPPRTRPIAVDDFALERRSGRMPTTPLLARADELISGAPDGPSVFVHGDVWPGNLMANGTLIDWSARSRSRAKASSPVRRCRRETTAATRTCGGVRRTHWSPVATSLCGRQLTRGCRTW
ncbi:phosphotransferase [Asanoa sp. NPDC049518]|uniref:phosphotransferase n=1 Tax=unclassified Asanoa TaxID=2685164 RepID=UPI00341A288F